MRFFSTIKGRDDSSPGENECLQGAAEADSEPCTSSQKPDQLVLEDGTKYDIADLEDDVVEQLYTSQSPLFATYFLVTLVMKIHQ